MYTSRIYIECCFCMLYISLKLSCSTHVIDVNEHNNISSLCNSRRHGHVDFYTPSSLSSMGIYRRMAHI
ncbi:hypothetical protein KXD40_005170 [Peronospora effusa]|nr:hypothetical protein KXD40_005170 [Peronospora effusa]